MPSLPLSPDRLAWWSTRLADPPEPTELPSGRARPAVLSPARTERRAPAPAFPGEGARAQDMAQRSDMTVLAAWVAYLARHSASSNARVAVGDADGWSLVLLDLADDPPFAEVRDRTAVELADASAHRVDLTELAARFDAADPSRAPLTLIGFATTEIPWPCSPLPDVVLRYDSAGKVALDAAADLFDDQGLAQVEERFLRLLTAAVREPMTTLSALPLLSEDERRRMVEEWNPPATPLPERCLHHLLAEAASDFPNRLAVVDDEARLTYRDLDQAANALAAELAAAGAGPDVLVGLCVERSAFLFVGLLAILKAGAAYVPVDPTYPAERVAMMFDSGGITLVVTEAALVGSLPAGPFTPVLVDTPRPPVAEPPPSDVTPTSLAYVIFTSGSTGRPKGVMIEHRGVVNLLTSMAREPGLQQGDRWLAVTTVSFDMAVPELYLPLLVGATIVVADRATAVDPGALARAVTQQGITVLQATPSTWQMLLDNGWRGEPRLRALCGGEPLPYPLAQALVPKVSELWNLYGPTETTVWSTMSRVEAGRGLSIGRPIANTRVYIVGPHGELLPPGSAGELLIGGEGLARGYLGQPDLTAERFRPDHISGQGRIYRTGDLARFRADGSLECLARLDNQVKIRGFRVELGEVETALVEQPQVAQAVVVAKKASAQARLVGYVVPAPGATVHPGLLRNHLRQRLPAYMVPSVIEVLEAFPLTPNGKVDRRALPEPGPQPASGTYLAPRDELERRIVAIWEEVLGISPIGARDNFFDLGVDSLTAARLFARIRTELGTATPLAPVFEAPTPEELADLARTGRRQQSGAPGALVPIQPRGTKRPLFCVHGGAGTILLFQPLARRLGPDQPLYGLQAVGLYGGEAPQRSVRAMAERYVREMRSVQPGGPYRVAGYCFGALVAYEMACQLKAADEWTELLISFNGPSPSYIARYRPLFDREGALRDEHGETVERARRRKPSLGSDLRHQLVGDGTVAERLSRTGAEAYRRARREAASRAQRARLELYLSLGRPLPDSLRENSNFQRIAKRAQDAYRPRPFPGGMLVVSGQGLYHSDDLGWSEHALGFVEAFLVPGRQPVPRRTMAEPWIGAVAERIGAALDALEPS